tara:strand:- start:85 stop:369 length:285 start_codon:yes stop_codon:yes gene_type:complete
MNTEEQVEIVRANGEGKRLEGRSIHRVDSWHSLISCLPLNFAEYEYRIVKQLETVQVTLWRNGTWGNVISSTDPNALPFEARQWEKLKTVTIEV